MCLRPVHVWELGKWLSTAQRHIFIVLPSTSLFLLIVHIFPALNDREKKKKKKEWIFSASVWVSSQLITLPNFYYPSFCCILICQSLYHFLSVTGLQRANNISGRESVLSHTNVNLVKFWNWEQNLVLCVEEHIPDCFYWKNWS